MPWESVHFEINCLFLKLCNKCMYGSLLLFVCFFLIVLFLFYLFLRNFFSWRHLTLRNFMTDLLEILQSVCHIFVKILSRMECSRMIHKIVNKPLDDRNYFDSNRKMYKKIFAFLMKLDEAIDKFMTSLATKPIVLSSHYFCHPLLSIITWNRLQNKYRMSY